MTYPLRLEGLLARIESSYGVDPTPAPETHGVHGVARIWPSLAGEFAFPNLNEDVVSNSLIGIAPGVAYGQLMTIDYRLRVRGAGVAYSSSTPVRPEVDPFLIAGGMSRTHVDTGSSESVAYAFADSGHGSITTWAYGGGKLFKISGIRGNWTLAPTAGALADLRFVGQGILTSITETAVPSITYSTVAPPASVAMALAIVPSGQSSWTPRAAGFELTSGHTIDRLDDVNGSEGIEGFEIGATNPRLSFTPRTKDLTTYNAWTYAKSRLVHTIDAVWNTAVQYNRLKIDINNAHLIAPPGHETEGNFAASRLEYLLRDCTLRFD